MTVVLRLGNPPDWRISLQDDQLHVTCLIAKKPLPKKTPTIREVIRKVAMLGGSIEKI